MEDAKDLILLSALKALTTISEAIECPIKDMLISSPNFS